MMKLDGSVPLAFLQKPFPPLKLVEKVRDATRSRMLIVEPLMGQ